MPKYWGKQIFTHGRFPEVGEKEKAEKKKKKEEEILQGLGVGPGSVTERWPSQKIARKLPFFLGRKKIT